MPVRDKPLILAVDDVPENIDVLKSILTPEYALSAAVNGQLALKIAERQLPDLILLDVMMPDLDGHQVLRRLKENEATRDIPVMFVSALGEEENELQGLELGAVDYVAKPISPKVLKARVATHLTLVRMRRELDEKKRHLEQERAFMEDVVLRMSQDSHCDLALLRVLHRLVDKTGGDLVLSAFRPNGVRHLLVGDFTGHGLPAALGGILVSHLFYDLTARDGEAAQVLDEVNRILFEQLPTNIYMAALMVERSADGAMLRVWNAGLPDCLVLRGDGQWLHLGSNLLPLGIVRELPPSPTATLAFAPGDRCYAFTDGLTEAENPAGELFGMARLKEALLRHRDGADLLGLERDLQNYSGRQPWLDDLTLVELAG